MIMIMMTIVNGVLIYVVANKLYVPKDGSCLFVFYLLLCPGHR